jgi:hypothetical protein
MVTNETYAKNSYTDFLGNNSEKLEIRDCVNAYAQNFVTSRSNVLLISGNVTKETSKVMTPEEQPVFTDTFSWVCDTSFVNCTKTGVAAFNATLPWNPLNASNIEYCLSEIRPEHCRLDFNLHIIVIVLVANLVKAVIMCFVAFWMRESPLMTLGDAVASFLDEPDPSTDNMCLISKADIVTERSESWTKPRAWNPERVLLWDTASGILWKISMPLYETKGLV